MASDVVQFREDAEVTAFLRARGLNPNEFARDAFERAYRRLVQEDAALRLSKVQARLPKRAAEVVREERESR